MKKITASHSSEKTFVSNKASCPHLLPMLRGHVIGAPKINPEVGQVVFNPQNGQQKFLRYFDYSKSLYLQINPIIFRTISTVGKNYCNMCYNMICSTKANNSDEKKQSTENHTAKSSIPGFSQTSEEKKTN